MKSAVPPVEYILMPRLLSWWMMGSKPDLSKTEMSAFWILASIKYYLLKACKIKALQAYYTVKSKKRKENIFAL